MKDVQCYELFGGIALKNHAFSFISFSWISLSFVKFTFHSLSGTKLHLHADLLAIHSSCIQYLFALEEIFRK